MPIRSLRPAIALLCWLVIGDFVIGVTRCRGRAVQFAERGLFGVRLLDERFGSVVVLATARLPVLTRLGVRLRTGRRLVLAP